MENQLFFTCKTPPGQTKLMVGNLKTGPKSGRIVRPLSRNNKFTRHSVLKMLSVMEASHKSDIDTGPSPSATTASSNNETTANNTNGVQDFLSSGRTGRRNALPDILGQHALVTSSDLPSRLASLSTTDGTDSSISEPNTSPGTSKS